MANALRAGFHPAQWRLLRAAVEPYAIGIAARSSSIHKQASAALEAGSIKTVSLSAKSAKNAVRVGTMHGMKGLEFQAVAR
jgi:superfamily I DNA/RNA helicase